MELEQHDWVAIVLLVVAVLATLFWTFKGFDDNRWYAAASIFSAWLIPVAIIPQLMKNTNAPESMEDVISPIFLLVYPATIVLGLPGVLKSIWVNDGSEESLKLNYVSLFGMTFRLLLYTAWLGQYAHHGHFEGFTISFTAIFSIVILCSMIVLGRAFKNGIDSPSKLENFLPTM